jgi:hypothetical protein
MNDRALFASHDIPFPRASAQRRSAGGLSATPWANRTPTGQCRSSGLFHFMLSRWLTSDAKYVFIF